MAVIAATSKNEINYASIVLFFFEVATQPLPDDTEGETYRPRPRLRLIDESKLLSARS